MIIQHRCVLQNLDWVGLFGVFFASHCRWALQFLWCFFPRLMSSLSATLQQIFSAKAECYLSLSACGYKLNHQIRTLKSRRKREKEREKIKVIALYETINTGTFTKQGSCNSQNMSWIFMDTSKLAAVTNNAKLKAFVVFHCLLLHLIICSNEE